MKNYIYYISVEMPGTGFIISRKVEAPSLLHACVLTEKTHIVVAARCSSKNP